MLWFWHLKFLYLQSLTVSTGSGILGTVHDHIRVHFFEIRVEEVVLGALCKVRAVARWNEVSSRLLRSIINLLHKLNRVWCAADE